MHSALSLIALAAVALMGFANQRGSTCTVAAIDQIVLERRFDQLIALCQVSLWVGGGLVLGGNDALVLVGMPLLWSYAWLAFASICITIFVATVITRR